MDTKTLAGIQTRMSEEGQLQVVHLRHLPEKHGLLCGVEVLPHEEGLRLLLWDTSQVFVFTGPDLDGLRPPAVLKLSEVKQVVGSDDSDLVLLLDHKGSLYLWREMAEEDLFLEDEPVQPQPTFLASGFLAISSSSLSNVFYGLVKDQEEKLQLVSFSVAMDALQENSSLTVGWTMSDRCSLNFFQSNSSPQELLSLLCPGTDWDEPCDVVVALLGTNVIYLCPLVSDVQERKVFEVCAAIQPVGHMVLAKDDGSAILAFADNAVLTIVEAEDGVLKRTEVPCVLGNVVCQVSMDTFYAADLLSSSKVSIGQQLETLPVRGTVAAACLEENVALVLTLHGVLYKVDLILEQNPEEEEVEEPDKLLDKISKTNELIRQTERAIKEENARLKEMAVVSSADLLKDTFRLQVRVHDLLEPDVCAFDVLVLNNSKFVFLENNWNLVLCLTGKDSMQTFNQKLSRTLKVGEAVKVVAKFRIKQLILPMKLQCQMLKEITVPSSSSLYSAEMPFGFVTLEVASIDLDITYFLTPTSVDPVTEYRQGQEEQNVDRLTCGRVHSRQWETNMDLDQVCRVLSQNCSHRSFGAIRASDRAAFLVAGRRVDLHWSDATLTVSSTDLPLVLDVLSQLQSSKEGVELEGVQQVASFQPEFFTQAENIGLAHDFAQLTGNLNEDLEFDLQEQLKKLVIQQFEFSQK